MAEKLLNTRILLKYDTLANWNATTTYLRKGEVAIATVASGDTQEVNSVTAPQVLVKVGDGKSLFKDLPFITAKAGDVYNWAKKASLDYNDLPVTLRDEIDALQAAVGTSGSVTNQIAAAIKAAVEALDVEDEAVDKQFVVAVPQTDGKVAVERRALVAADIPTIEESQVNGLTKKLGDLNTAIEAEVTARETAVEGAKTHAQGLVNALANDAVKKNTDAIAEIKDEANGILAQAKADATQKANDALVAAKEDATSKANQALADAKTYTNTEIEKVNGVASGLETRVKANEDAIKVINGAATEEGSLAKVAADAAKAVQDEAKRAGDKETELAKAIAIEKGRIDAFFADADMTADAIDTLKELQAEIASDNTGAAAMAENIQKNKDAIEAEVKRATEKEGELAQAITDEATAREQADNKHTQDITGINNKIGTAAISNGKGTLIEAINANSAAITAEQQRAEGVEASLLAKIGTVAEGQNLAALIAANTKAIGDEVTARDTADKQHTADIKVINDKVGAETLTLGGTLISAINANTAAIAAEVQRADAAEKKALSDAKAHAEAKVKELADGQVKTNTDAITAINNNKNIVKSVKGDDVIKASIANNELTIDFDDTLTFVFNCGTSANLDPAQA